MSLSMAFALCLARSAAISSFEKDARGAIGGDVLILGALFVASFWAGAQNALAGGGSFITLPALILTGMDARAANITSTVALFPAQLITGYTGRASATGLPELSFKELFAISLAGGAVGGIILLATPASFFAMLVPWLVLFATAIFAWGSFFRRQPTPGDARLPRWGAAASQLLIAIYGGYFGGGIGFLMMAALSMAGQGVRNAGATKNVLAGVINASAVAIFVFSSDVHWLQVAITAVGASLGGWAGALALQRVNENALRIGVVAIGILLTIGLFLRAP
jgi:uncharacterized membrane protein YfcA